MDDTIEEVFTDIYDLHTWAGDSVSGRGSTLPHTTNIRRYLPRLFKKFNIKSIYDAPCGDFGWMKFVVDKTGIEYIGADIVKPLIDELVEKHSSKNVKFVHSDITKDPFPKADLWMCRDCLFHLSMADTAKVLTRFMESDIPYILTTTYKPDKGFQNGNIKTGGFRHIDLFAMPYRFPKEPLYRFDDWREPEMPREMCLWSQDQIRDCLTPA